MSSENTSVPHNWKRQLSTGSETDPRKLLLSPPLTKRPKLKHKQLSRTTPSFADNRSKNSFTCQALQEFDRRTVWPAALLPPDRSGEGNICLAQFKRFAKHGGPSLTDLRARPGLVESETESEDPLDETDFSDYHDAFWQNLADHKIYPPRYYGVYNPRNWEEINARLALPRASLSPSRFNDEAFLDFQDMNQRASIKSSITSKVLSIIAGSAEIFSSGDLLFGNLKHLTDGSPKLKKARPDFYDGSYSWELNTKILKKLERYIVPSRRASAPCLPNFFAVIKAPTEDNRVSQNQTLYVGALGARGMHKLQTYVDSQTTYDDDNAYTIATTYDGGSGTLTMYTTHPAYRSNPRNPRELDSQELDGPVDEPEYYITQLRAFAMTDSPETFRQGARAFRNLRDWAKEKRDEAIKRANERANDIEATLPAGAIEEVSYQDERKDDRGIEKPKSVPNDSIRAQCDVS